MKRQLNLVLMLGVVFGVADGLHAEEPAPAFYPVDVTRCFVTPDRPTSLAWQDKTKARAARDMAYTICDYRGKIVTSGKAAVDNQGRLELSVTLARGYYEVSFAKTGDRFGIIAIPETEDPPDPFFAIDGALSWLVPKGEVRRGLVKCLKRAGIAMVRERYTWGNNVPKVSETHWEGGDRKRAYDTLRRQFLHLGIPVLEVFHNAPSSVGLIERYPDDLVKTADAWKRIGAHWEQVWGAIEVWNEPDIFFGGNLPGDQYMAVVKAVARGLAVGGCETPVVGGVFAHYDRPFLDSTANNGMLDLVDVVSFHTYGHAEQMESLVARYRQWLGDNDHAAKPLWLTECGRPWKRGHERPELHEDTVSALDIAMKAVEARACGVQRYFAFVYPYYEERTSNFAMMGKRATPLRSMGAYVQVASRLGGLKYLGDLSCGAPGLRRVRLFGNTSETIAVIYTGKIEPGSLVRLPVSVLRAESIDGRMLKVEPSNSVPIPDGLAYVWLSRDQLKGYIKIDTLATKLTKAAAGKTRPTIPPGSIVLRYQFDKKQVDAKTQGYALRDPIRSNTVLTTRVFNLGDSPKDLRLQLTTAAGTTTAISEPSRRVRLAPRSHTDVSWKIDMPDLLGPTGRVTLVLNALSDTNDNVATLVIDVKGNPSLPQVISRFKSRRRLRIDQPSRWRPSIVGHGKMTMKRTEGGAWRLDATFGEGDRWVYPSLQLPADVDLSKWTTIVIRARCAGPATVHMFLWEGDSGVGYLSPGLAVDTDKQWYTVVVRLDAFTCSSANTADANGRLDLDNVRRLSIGMNTKQESNWLEVSDLVLVK